MQKTVKDIREEFLSFFEKHDHKRVESSSLVPQNDPTLMFTNAGMVQFKDVFTGKEKRDYRRATTSQKCLRAGGKHNDLENVGYTARHHTFFEMLGNFSFGDYFKDDAIAMAWELVTKNFGLDPQKLLVTVHATDEEAAEIWKKVTGFADEKILRIPTDDNFWRMGDTGPCGPCTEIFYDHGDHIWGGPPGSPEEDGDRFIEIWNNVFMQFEQIDPETRIDLPAQSVDTGMGLERIAATLMGSNNNYDIDIFTSLRDHSADLTGHDPESASHKVVADHLRASAFLLADGVMPSNEGRGYVLRRIMRRGMRHAHLMGARDPLMYQLFPTLLSTMGEAYPELKEAEALITQTLESEEKRFKATLDKGLKLLDEETQKLGSSKTFPGDVAFKLYDTFGFPLDLTQDALKAQGITVDTDGFDTCMAEQKAAARAAWSGSGDAATEKIWFDLLDEFGPTEFLGYDSEEAEAQVLAIVKDGQRVDTLKAGEEGYILTNQTPFYAESGGQVGDSGLLVCHSGEGRSLTESVKDPGLRRDDPFESRRLKYEAVTNDHLQDVFDTMNYQNTAETISFMTWPMTMDQAKQWIERGQNSKDLYFLTRDKDTKKPVGCVGIYYDDVDPVEIGYWVSEIFQGQGYATEILSGLLEWAFEYLDVDHFYATTLLDNHASSRVLEKNGFVFKECGETKSVDGNIYKKNIYDIYRGAFIKDTKKMAGKLHVHDIKMIGSDISVGDAVQMKVNHGRRSAIRSNHSATHLLHEALRQTLGDHVAQKGSLQDDARTRFDISHPQAITDEELEKVEKQVNAEIQADTDVITRLMPLEEARESGARALFGEKYDEEVRVVSMGSIAAGANHAYSVELCGGTHVKRTGEIGKLKIVSEGALSAGVRRLEAVTGERVDAYEAEQNQKQADELNRLVSKHTALAEELKTLGGEAEEIDQGDIDQLNKANKKLQKQIDEKRRNQATEGASEDAIEEINGVKFIGKVLGDFPPKDLKPMADQLKQKIGSGVVVLIAGVDKASIVVGVTDDLTGRLNAVDLVKAGAEVLGGKGGGGRPDMAQAGGPNADKADDAVKIVGERI